MISKIQKLLNNNEENYIFPFFWQHGEDEDTLRKYMRVIYESNIKAVCVESRPHPDFCGPKWWKDMDIILDEARKREMKVWILDDSHFPTGFANGAAEKADISLRRQNIYCHVVELKESEQLNFLVDEFSMKKSMLGARMDEFQRNTAPECQFTDNTILSVTAVKIQQDGSLGNNIQIPYSEDRKQVVWKAGKGIWKVFICLLTRNSGIHRRYINMMDKDSCRLLIDSVYEPHYKHYKADFGTTIAGFFSDEPELGNGEMFNFQNLLGTDQDLPWSKELEERLKASLDEDEINSLYLLWENDGDSKKTAKIRYTYMNLVTRLVQQNFSYQVGDWCREHGVEYIGHVIEDNNQHARTGSSLGHFFRGLSGQDMSGIDDIGGQVLPQGEDLEIDNILTGKRDGEFYHFVLGKLGVSHAAIDFKKHGRTMCEIFGNYGWEEGVRLERYLADHFMVRGVNRFVPHAFSPKSYPDPDCPPHFYAHGNNPQYRHFGCLMRYMNRICELISDGRTATSTAIIYHGEAEWSGSCMLMQKPARILAENQVDYHFIPIDVFTDEEYNAKFKDEFSVNGYQYKVLIVPYSQFIPEALEKGIEQLVETNCEVIFIDKLPDSIIESMREPSKAVSDSKVISLENLYSYIQKKSLQVCKIEPSGKDIRCLNYKGEPEIYYIVNEGNIKYNGIAFLDGVKELYAYDAWLNQIYQLNYKKNRTGVEVELSLNAGESCIIVCEENKAMGLSKKIQVQGSLQKFKNNWKESICRSKEYPNFHDAKLIKEFKNVGCKYPEFSGFICYENEFDYTGKNRIILEITDAYEGVEVFINNQSIGIQILPPFLYDLSEFVSEGTNKIRIEVATTLERERCNDHSPGKDPKDISTCSLTGIVGEVNLYY